MGTILILILSALGFSQTAQAAVTVTSSAVGSSSVAPGGTQNVSVSLRSSNRIRNGIVQLNIHDASYKVIAKHDIIGQSFRAGQTRSFSKALTIPEGSATGTYYFSVNVFNSNWSSLAWLDKLRNFSVGAAPVPLDFTATSSNFSLGSVAPGQSQTVSVSIRATADVANLNVQINIHDGAYSVLAKKDIGAQTFTAGETKSYSFTFTVPADAASGARYLSVGIFDSTWKSVKWLDRVNSFTVATAIPTPSPSPAPAPAPAPTPTPLPSPAGLMPSGAPIPQGWSLKQSDRFGSGGNVTNAQQLFSKYVEGLWFQVEYAPTVEESSGRVLASGNAIPGEQQTFVHFEDSRVFNFKADRLTIQARGQSDGKILSGQIVSRYNSRSFCIEARLKMPTAKHSFPAFWQYANSGHYGKNDASEIDVETPISADGHYTRNVVTMFNHGNALSNIQIHDSRVRDYTFKDANFDIGQPHYYTTCYDDSGAGKMSRYIDGKLMYEATFKWNGKLGGTGYGVNASTIINFSVGSTIWQGIGLVPDPKSFADDMDVYSVDYYAP